jgi:hypothetical protein
MIDLESVTKIGALTGVIAGVKTALENLVVLRHKKLKDDYELAKTFFSESTDEVDRRFVEERGFQALSGTSDITGAAARRLIALDSTGALLRSYNQAKHFIVLEKHDTGRVFAYLPKYGSKLARRVHQIFYAGMFLIFASLAIVATLMSGLFDEVPNQSTTTLLMGMLGYSIGGIFAMRKAEGMIKAIELVNSQAT